MVRGWWEIGPGIKRPAFVVNKHRHGPTTVTGYSNRCFHIDGVNIRTLFTIHLDIDKMLVEKFRHIWIFE
jgi:hypothetical protein